ncbi:hypothetical protein E4T44_01511 [Aureobasidium sp. EXF-8845]|nr:hypothetical protein E4T44_01511 [Aureobasidium sp. EXF-8845]
MREENNQDSSVINQMEQPRWMTDATREFEYTANGSILTPSSQVTYGNSSEPFETFQNKVIALAPELHVEFQNVERVTGGANHRIIGLTMRNPPVESGFSDATQAVLRVSRLDPYEPVEGDPEYTAEMAAKLAAEVSMGEIDEAAVLSLLARSGIKVPSVLACDITRQNALNYPYLLQTRLPGTTLWKVWDDMSVDDKINIAGEVAEFLAKMDTVRFPVSGRLLYDESSKTTKIPLDSAMVSEIGKKLVVRGFHRHFENIHERDAPTAPPPSSLYELLCIHLDARNSKLVKVQAMLQDMKDMNWFATDDDSAAYSIVDHAQLNTFNIMVEHTEDTEEALGWHVSGVLGWDDAHCIPPVLARRPLSWLMDFPDGDSFAQNFHDGSSIPSIVRGYHQGDSDMLPLEYYQKTNSDPLTARIKERFEQVLVERIYTPRYGARAMEVHQDDTYGRGRYLRRLAHLVMDARTGPDQLRQVLNEWAEFKETGQVSHATVFEKGDDSEASGSTTSTIAYDHEPFETFQHRVTVLGENLGVPFTEIERMRGGSFNRVVPVTLQVAPETASWKSLTKAVIRIPRVWDGDLAKIPASQHGQTCKCDAHPERKKDDGPETSALVSDGTAKESASDEVTTDPKKPSDIDISNGKPSAEDDGVSDTSDISDISSRRSLSKEPYRWEILDEAVLYNLLEDSGISAPRTLAFDISRENALNLPYSIQTRLPGVTWMRVIEDMPLSSQLSLAEGLAKIMARLQTIQFESSGRLMCDEQADTPLKLSLHSPIRTEVKEKLETWGFPQGVGSLMDKARIAPAQPVWDSLYDLLFHTVHDLLTRELQKVEPEGPSEQLVRMYFKLQDMIQDMDRIGWFSEADKAPSKSVLHHWDLEARNILVEQADSDPSSLWRITGVIDWDHPHALPPVLCMKPPIWLWDASDDADLPENVAEYYDNDFDWMPLEYYQKENAENFNADGVKVKQRFEEAIVKSLYSAQYGERAHAKYLDDAYGRGRWLRRVWRFASEGLSMYPTHWRRMQQLDREWTEYKRVNGIAYDHHEHAETLRVHSSMVWPNRAREGGQSEFKGISHDVLAESEQAKEPKTPANTHAKIDARNTLDTIALDPSATVDSTTEDPKQRLPRSKTFSSFLHSFKCSPS